MTTMTVKGQVTIPKAVREAAGIKPGDKVSVTLAPDGKVSIGPVPTSREESYRHKVEAVRRAAPLKGMVTTDEFMKMIRSDD
ncbi:AbrB/MazE/SpoVT family DNA-binding domain-containing protein [Phreatobacter sp.]|uniref:AbrB/MazE/SpoVT family DNA-binding domain-containing protein n=1 Tax=Phreatobacter sp. TaxID=1966341 RepID=UPI003F730067